MLNACGQRTIACGNIGKPLSEVARENQPLDVLTVEVSSFQLEAIRAFRPSISLWLNFAPDHLDRYRSVAEYRAAKLRIFENQTEQDVAVVNAAEALPTIRPVRLLSALIPIAPISGYLTAQSFMKISRSCAWLTRSCRAT
jgi:UDP-N-acetylmuramoylalanine-D-glutamate ligase